MAETRVLALGRRRERESTSRPKNGRALLFEIPLDLERRVTWGRWRVGVDTKEETGRVDMVVVACVDTTL